jgi:hypothetical protein
VRGLNKRRVKLATIITFGNVTVHQNHIETSITLAQMTR